jgi:DNA invertase Pin-like site-specific DNA recombinase
MQVCGYVRVSTEEQARDGVSLAAQQAKLEAYALVKDWTVLRLIRDEGASAKHLKRPGLEALLSLVRTQQIEAVMVYKLDRLTRSVKDLSTLVELFEKHGVALVSLQESLDATTATGRLMMNLLASVSQWEREVIGERTRDALQHLKAQGQRYCHARFEEHPHAGPVLALMQARRAAGDSYEAIATHLNMAGIPATLGGRWFANAVRKILLRTTPPRARRIA